MNVAFSNLSYYYYECSIVKTFLQGSESNPNLTVEIQTCSGQLQLLTIDKILQSEDYFSLHLGLSKDDSTCVHTLFIVGSIQKNNNT